jgi:biofilm PGA synthesis N-glycosyltransferase PgaC
VSPQVHSNEGADPLYGLLLVSHIEKGHAVLPFYGYLPMTQQGEHEVAVLIASKDGEKTIADSVRSAVGQASVFVVSDGSSDRTAEVAREAGAEVLALEANVGKPAALYRAITQLRLTSRYQTIAIIDDDTVIAPDFVAKAMEKLSYYGVAIAVGRTITRWSHANRWNVWLASRAYSYWRYQITYRRAQSALNILTCISGSNSVYRSSVLAQVLVEQTPYIVDDTYWTLETHRRKLGNIVYAPEARAHIQDPTSMRAWYKQNVRWLWGTFQGIRGHRCGRHRTLFDLTYGLQMADWILYVLSGPITIALIALGIWWNPMLIAILTAAGYFMWTIPAAIALGKWRLIPLTPFLLVVDWLYRVVFVHALVKTIRQPVVVSCIWESPPRY